jgi:hypothetical protein
MFSRLRTGFVVAVDCDAVAVDGVEIGYASPVPGLVLSSKPKAIMALSRPVWMLIETKCCAMGARKL